MKKWRTASQQFQKPVRFPQAIAPADSDALPPALSPPPCQPPYKHIPKHSHLVAVLFRLRRCFRVLLFCQGGAALIQVTGGFPRTFCHRHLICEK